MDYHNAYNNKTTFSHQSVKNNTFDTIINKKLYRRAIHRIFVDFDSVFDGQEKGQIHPDPKPSYSR